MNMTRVKRGKTSLKRRKKVLKQTKGFRGGRKSKERQAKTALNHAGVHAFHDRRKKKRVFRKSWQIKINAASRQHGLSYSQFINALKKADIGLDRKIMADLAENHPEIFAKILEQTKTKSKK
ncbi:MAG: 50S ribosomal protein L20 [Parcubacteria group bacterium GW2011_GWB1_41_6]|nr:MAG: 50S ribosomal protein L20 [Parcubacteria group bacterium GW2011_GWB1_41_6]